MVNIGEQAREVAAQSQSSFSQKREQNQKSATPAEKAPDDGKVENSSDRADPDLGNSQKEPQYARGKTAAEISRQVIGATVRNSVTASLFTPNTQAAMKQEVLDPRARIKPKGNDQDLTEKETVDVMQKAYGLTVGITGGALLNGIFDQNEIDAKKGFAVESSRGNGLAATLAKTKEAFEDSFTETLNTPHRKGPVKRSRGNEGPEL